MLLMWFQVRALGLASPNCVRQLPLCISGENQTLATQNFSGFIRVKLLLCFALFTFKVARQSALREFHFVFLSSEFKFARRCSACGFKCAPWGPQAQTIYDSVSFSSAGKIRLWRYKLFSVVFNLSQITTVVCIIPV